MIQFFLKIFSNNIAAFQVLSPFIGALLCCLLPQKGRIWLFALFSSFITLIISALLFYQIYNTGSISYQMGGWQAPYGIEFRIDYLNSLLILLTSFIAFISILGSKEMIETTLKNEKISLYYGISLFCICGYIGMLITNDIFNLYVFLEIASISSYAIAAMGNSKFSSHSAFIYLIYGTIAASFILLGIGMIYMVTGSLNISDLAVRIPLIIKDPTLKLGAIFFIIGTLLKTGIFPLHLWVPNLYQNSPSPFAAFLSGVSSNVSIYILIRFMFTIIDTEKLFAGHLINHFLLYLSIAAIFFGSITAFFQPNLKRIFAFSSIGYLGYIILCLAIGSKDSFATSIILMMHHSIVKPALMLISGTFEHDYKKRTLRQFSGISKKMPFASAAIAINLASLAGIPFTSGFIGKWQVLKTVLSMNYWLLFPIIISSLFTIGYCVKIIEKIYFKDDPDENLKEPTNIDIISNKSKSASIAIFILTLTNIFFGIFSVYYFEIAKFASTIKHW